MRPASPAAAIRRRLVQTTAVAALLAGIPSLAQVAPDALPFGEDRSDLVDRSGTPMLITLDPLAPRTVINWASYDIGSAASVRYTNKGGVAVAPVAVLNRVTGLVNDSGQTTITASNILGSLTSEDNISVFLVNPAGIMFGQNATVAVGSLIASTRDIEPRTFLSSLTNAYRFTGTSDVPDPDELVLDGDRAITAGSTAAFGFKANDVVALIAARVITRGTITAGREVAIVAADDTTLTLNPGSPLQIRIDAGTSIRTPMLLRGTLKGGSVMIAAATRTGLTDGLLDIDATMEASSATESDQGIILSAGRTAQLNDSITMPTNSLRGAPSDNDGEVGVVLGGAMNATGVAGTIDLRARNGMAGQPGPGGVATLTADRSIYVRTDAARLPAGGADPIGVALGDVTSRLVSATATGIDISAGAGSVSAGAVTAGIVGAGGAGASVVASSGAVDVASLFASGAATISGTAVTVGGTVRSDGGSLTVTASGGGITADSLGAAGLLQATATKGNLVVDSVASKGGTVQVRAIDVIGRNTAGKRASIAAGQDVGLVATGLATLGTVDGRTIDARAAGNLSATRLSASAGGPTSDGLYATAATLDVGTAQATGSTARLIATGGGAAVTSLNAAIDGVLTASGQATLRGGGIAGRDLLVSGAQVRLGTPGGGGTQQAGRNAVYAASAGTIAGVAADTGLVIRANASSGGAGSIVLDANTGIDLTGIALSTGDPTGTAPIGNVGIRLGSAGAPLTLGATDANALLSVDAAHTTFSPLATAGAVTLGTTRLVDGLALSTPGTIRLAGVTIFGDGDTLSVTGTGAANTITASGLLSASGGVRVTAPGLVSIADVAGGDGIAAIQSTGAALSAGAVTGGIVAARARDALSVGSAIANAGPATLTSVTAGITVNNATLASGDVTVDAPGAIRMGAVRSTGGTVLFRSTTVPVFGDLNVGAVQARTNLTVSRATGITLASARSDIGAVTLTSASGAVVVNGPTDAATTASLTGRSLTLGAVTGGGDVTLDAHGVIRAGDVSSTGGTLVFRSTASPATGAVIADAVSAKGDLIVTRDPGISFASATSTDGRVSLTSGGAVAVSGATVAGTSVTVAAGDATLGNVTARGGAVDLSAGIGALRAGQLLATGSIRAFANTTATISDATSAGADVTAIANGDLLSGALSAATSVQARAIGSATLGDVTAGSGSADLIAVNGGIRAGAVTAGGNVTFDAPGVVRAGNVRSIGGSVVFRSTSTPVTGDVIADAVSANGDLIVVRDPGISFASATATNGRVSLTSRGTVAVSDATVAGMSVTVGAGAATLGDVTARNGAVDLSAGVGALRTGQLLATRSIRVVANTTATIAGATSFGADVTATANGDLVTGVLRAGNSVQARATGAATLGDVTAEEGFADLAAVGGVLGAGAVSAGGYVKAAANGDLTLARATSSSDRVELTSGVGRVEVAGAVTARNFVTVDAGTGARLGSVADMGTGASLLRARGGALVVTGATSVGGPLSVEGSTGVALGATASTRGSVTIASTAGVIAAPIVDAAAGIDVGGQQTLTLGEVNARGGSMLLLSRAGAITANGVIAQTTLNADAATTLGIGAATVGTDATLAAREVTLGTVDAGTLAATARGGDLTLAAGDIRGAATLTKTGIGEISVARLAGAGPIRITSDGAVRADQLTGGDTTVIAAGDVSGRTGGLSADVASLAVTAGGTTTIAALTTAGNAGVSATGQTLLSGSIAAGGDLIASGSSVTLGSGAPVAQGAGGRIGVTSTGGVITGLGGLTLRSDVGGAGGRDLTLQSAAGIDFAGNTLMAGGSDRQSAVRLAAAAGFAITLGTVEARTIASPGTAAALSHGGPLSIGRVETQDSLAVGLTGIGNALTIGSVKVRGGDLSLDASGALSTGAIAAGGGTTTLGGATVSSGGIVTRGLAATARGGSATFSTIDATAGGVAVAATTDLRVTRATATGPVALTSNAGDITGNTVSGGFAGAVLASSGGAVSVRAKATDGSRGIVVLDTVGAAGGIDLSGRTIDVESLTSSGGAVTARTRRDGAGITDQWMRIGTVSAAGSIVLETGNRSAASDGTLALDRATSSGGDIAITTVGGGVAGRSASSRTILSAPGGTIVLDIGGPAVLGSASARATTIAASALDVTTADATVGPLALTARNGSLLLGTGTAGGAATLSAASDFVATRVTADTTLAASADTVTLGTLVAGADSLVTGTRRVTIGTAATPGTLTVAGRTISVTDARLGGLDATAGAGGIDLRTGTVAGAARIASGAALAFGTLQSGNAALTAATDVIGDRLTADRTASIGAGRDAVLGAIAGGGDLTLSASRTLAAGDVTTPAALSLTAAAVNVGSATAGTLNIRTAGALTADLLAARTDLDIVAGSGKVTTTRVTGGAARIATGDGGLALAGVAVGGDLNASTTGDFTAGTLDAGGRLTASGASATIGQATARAGDLGVTATAGDIRLGTGAAGGGVALTSSGASAVTGAVGAGGRYRIDAASIVLGAAGATARQAGAEVALTARAGAVNAQGSTTLAAIRGIVVTANGSGGAIGFAPESAITAGTGDVILATRGSAALGTVTASAGAIRLDAADAALTRAVSARAVTLTNVASSGITRLGDTGVGNETEFGTSTTRFDLSNAEVGLVAAPGVTIASGARGVVVGALALNAATGATRFAITADGRVDMLGRFVAAGSPASRTIAIGNEASGTTPRTGVIRVAATPAEGGRLIVDGAALELTAERIGVGYDRDFLDAIGYRSAGLGVDQVTREYVARPTSTLYNASGLGAQPYTDTVLVRSGTLGLTYGRYALIQNTGRPGEQRGVVIGSAGGNTTAGATVRLAAPGSSENTFSLFGTVDGISSTATALLGPDRLSLDPNISPVASRINGCVIGSGAGCLNTSIAQPSINLFDTSRAEIVRTADDLSLPFDPLIGTNNEALYLDPAAEQTPPDCEGDTPCPPKP